MKFVLLMAGSLLTVSFSFAADLKWPNPENFCTGGCPKEMQSIADDFRAHGQLPDYSQGQMIGSGGCFHVNPQLNPEHMHYGVSVLDNAGGVPTISSLFAFFPKEDPWAQMTPAEIVKYMKDRGSKVTPAELTEKDARIAFPAEKSTLYYWVRSFPEAKQLLLISLWDFQAQGRQYIFCRLNVH